MMLVEARILKFGMSVACLFDVKMVRYSAHSGVAGEKMNVLNECLWVSAKRE